MKQRTHTRCPSCFARLSPPQEDSQKKQSDLHSSSPALPDSGDKRNQHQELGPSLLVSSSRPC